MTLWLFMFIQSYAPRYGYGEFLTFRRQHPVINAAYKFGAASVGGYVSF